MDKITKNKMKKQSKLTLILSGIFYLYLSLLSLLAFASLAFEKDIWYQFTTLFDYNTNVFGFLLFHFYSLIVFSFSAVLSTLLVGIVTFPKNKWLAIIIVFDAPVALLIDYYTGNQISLAEFVMYDFTFELLAILLASNFLFFIEKKNFLDDEPFTLHFLSVVIIAVLFSFYGLFTYNILSESSLKSLLLFAFAIITTTIGYYKVLKQRAIENENPETETEEDKDNGLTPENKIRKYMFHVASISMFVVWALIAYIYIGKIFF